VTLMDGVHQLQRAIENGFGQTVPFDCGVERRRARIEQPSFSMNNRASTVISPDFDPDETDVFLIGDRCFGTVMVYAHEPYAANYKFTSALPVQLLKSLLPTVMPLLEQGRCDRRGR